MVYNDLPIQDLPIHIQDLPIQDLPIQDLLIQDLPIQDLPIQDLPIQDLLPEHSLPEHSLPEHSLRARKNKSNMKIQCTTILHPKNTIMLALLFAGVPVFALQKQDVDIVSIDTSTSINTDTNYTTSMTSTNSTNTDNYISPSSFVLSPARELFSGIMKNIMNYTSSSAGGSDPFFTSPEGGFMVKKTKKRLSKDNISTNSFLLVGPSDPAEACSQSKTDLHQFPIWINVFAETVPHRPTAQKAHRVWDH